MLSQDEILKLRQQVGIPDEGVSAPPQTADERISNLRSSIPTEQGGMPPSLISGGVPVDVQKGMIKGTLATIRGMGVAGQEFLQQTAGRVIQTITGKPKQQLGSPLYEGPKPSILESKNKAEQLGQFSVDVGSYLIPETFFAKTLTKAPGLIRGGVQIAKDVAITQAKEGEGSGTTGVISAATRSIIPGVQFLGSILQRGIGLIAARGTDLIDEVVKNPTYAKLGLRGDPVQILKDSAIKLSNYATEIKKAAITTFREGLTQIEKDYQKILQGFKVNKPTTPGGLETIQLQNGTTIIKDPTGNKFNLSLQSLKSELTRTLNKEFSVAGNTKKGFDFSQSTLSNSESNAVSEALAKLQNWKDITPTGLNRLADAIKGFAKPEKESFARANAVLFKLASNIDDYLVTRVPAFKQLNQSFANSQKFLEELRVHLNAVGKTTSAQEIQRISSKIQNLFGANKDTAREFLRSLPGGEQILATEAGRQLRVADISKASGAIGNFVANLIQTALPPKAIGYLAAHFGTSKALATKIYNTLKPFGEAERVTIINLLRELMNR